MGGRNGSSLCDISKAAKQLTWFPRRSWRGAKNTVNVIAVRHQVVGLLRCCSRPEVLELLIHADNHPLTHPEGGISAYHYDRGRGPDVIAFAGHPG